MHLPRLKEIKNLYDQGANVMHWFRRMEASEVNSLEGILVSYDLQAGSYVRALEDPGTAAFVERYTGALGALLDRWAPRSVMEAGVGEATTLSNVLRQMRRAPERALGFDIAWSRVAVAREYAARQGVPADLFAGNLTQIPLEDSAVEVVYTSHSIEPNRGREQQILAELYRVARRYLVLLEPSNELGSEGTRRHIEEHKYCLDLGRHARELGYDVIEHRLFEHVRNPVNQTALVVIAKEADAEPYGGGFFACPRCRAALTLHHGNYFCGECLVVYPVIAGVPCLLATQGVVATRYLEKA
jgi:ubiquinone/menaquinone biosynthesis C-methylase UbiE